MKSSIGRVCRGLCAFPLAVAAGVACSGGSAEAVDTSSSAIWPIPTPIPYRPCWLNPSLCGPPPAVGALRWARKISDAPGIASAQTANFGANGQLVIGGQFSGGPFTLGAVPPVPGIGIWTGAFGAALDGATGVAEYSYQATSNESGLAIAGKSGQTIFVFDYSYGSEATGTGQSGEGGSFGVAVLNAQGAVVAFETFGAATAQGDPLAGVSALAQLTNGNWALTGTYVGTVPFGTQTLTSVNPDSFVLELDSQLGVVSLLAAHGSTNGAQNRATALTVDASGNMVLGGSADATTTSLFGCPFPAGSPLVSPAFFVSLTPGGHCNWLKKYEFGTSEDTSVSSIASEPGGGVVAGGTFTDVTASQQSSFAGYLVSLDPNGAVLWSNQYPSTIWSQVNTVAVDRWGEVVAGGAFGGKVNLGKGPLSGTDEGFVLKLTSGGQALWNTAFDGAANGVAVDASGNVAVVGEFFSSTEVEGDTLTDPARAAIVFELSP